MRQIWVTDAETMIIYFDMIAKIEDDFERDLTREERELVFLKLMKAKDIKPSGNTELNQAEFIKEIVSKGKKVLNIDEKGIRFIKKNKGEKE